MKGNTTNDDAASSIHDNLHSEVRITFGRRGRGYELYIYIYIYIYMYVCMYIYIYIYICIHVLVYIHIITAQYVLFRCFNVFDYNFTSYDLKNNLNFNNTH